MTNKERFIALCKETNRDGMDGLLEWLETSDFYKSPASARFHGNYEGGLLEHSLNVYDELNKIKVLYPEITSTDVSTTISSLFHDLCKVNTYVTEKRNRKNEAGQWESYDAYTSKPRMNFGGHGSKSVFIVQQFMKLTPEEAIAINCHMSCWDGDKSCGSAFEQYPLAWAVHVADEAATFIKEGKC